MSWFNETKTSEELKSELQTLVTEHKEVEERIRHLETDLEALRNRKTKLVGAWRDFGLINETRVRLLRQLIREKYANAPKVEVRRYRFSDSYDTYPFVKLTPKRVYYMDDVTERYANIEDCRNIPGVSE